MGYLSLIVLGPGPHCWDQVEKEATERLSGPACKELSSQAGPRGSCGLVTQQLCDQDQECNPSVSLFPHAYKEDVDIIVGTQKH